MRLELETLKARMFILSSFFFLLQETGEIRESQGQQTQQGREPQRAGEKQTACDGLRMSLTWNI